MIITAKESAFVSQNLWVLNTTTGQPMWDLPDVDDFVIEASNIFIRLSGKIQCQDMKNGNVIRERPVSSISTVTMAAHGNTLFVGEGRRLYALDSGSGKNLWNKEFSNSINHVLVEGDPVCVWASGFGGNETKAFKLAR